VARSFQPDVEKARNGAEHSFTGLVWAALYALCFVRGYHCGDQFFAVVTLRSLLPNSGRQPWPANEGGRIGKSAMGGSSRSGDRLKWPRYKERRKFKISCCCDGLSALKLLMTR
jgi:hypothetical protein